VQVPRNTYRGVMRGMCGANSGNTDDDYRMNGGSYVGRDRNPGATIGDSYVVPDPDVTDVR
jgi:hypothetical protein